jgi:hypothetical protein
MVEMVKYRRELATIQGLNFRILRPVEMTEVIYSMQVHQPGCYELLLDYINNIRLSVEPFRDYEFYQMARVLGSLPGAHRVQTLDIFLKFCQDPTTSMSFIDHADRRVISEVSSRVLFTLLYQSIFSYRTSELSKVIKAFDHLFFTPYPALSRTATSFAILCTIIFTVTFTVMMSMRSTTVPGLVPICFVSGYLACISGALASWMIAQPRHVPDPLYRPIVMQPEEGLVEVVALE